MRLLLIGPPGSGKGTQGQRLGEALHLPHIATGDLIRDHIARKTEFGRKVEAAIAAGNFASDQDITYWVSRRLEEPDAQRGYVLDGFPRDLAQGQAFDAQSPDGRAFDAVIELSVPEGVLVTRLSGRLVCPNCDRVYHTQFHPPVRPGHCDVDGGVLFRRPDDAPEAVKHRFAVYETVTLPLRDYYRREGLLHTVSAEGKPDAVFEHIRDVLPGHEGGPKSVWFKV